MLRTHIELRAQTSTLNNSIESLEAQVCLPMVAHKFSICFVLDMHMTVYARMPRSVQVASLTNNVSQKDNEIHFLQETVAKEVCCLLFFAWFEFFKRVLDL